MSDLARGLKNAAHSAGETCDMTNGRIIREFGLNDFLENAITPSDDAATICVRAVKHFCEETDPKNPCFRFGVLTICLFLHHHHGRKPTEMPTVAMGDLVKILRTSWSEEAVRSWVSSHFG